MPRLALGNDLTRGDVEGSEPGSCTVPFIVVSLPFRQGGAERKNRLSAIQRLDLTLLIHAEHDCLVGRIQVETDDVTDFGDEVRVGAEFERLHPMGLEVMFLPDALHGRGTDPLSFRHRTDAPMGRMSRGTV